jgi:hypothetical protein
MEAVIGRVLARHFWKIICTVAVVAAGFGGWMETMRRDLADLRRIAAEEGLAREQQLAQWTRWREGVDDINHRQDERLVRLESKAGIVRN